MVVLYDIVNCKFNANIFIFNTATYLAFYLLCFHSLTYSKYCRLFLNVNKVVDFKMPKKIFLKYS